MGLFDFLKGKEEPTPAPITFPVDLGAVTKGEYVSMENIPDPVFSTGVLGRCCGITPEEGKVYAPIDGKVTQVADTLHAVGLETNGIEILIHIGVDTVDMNGDGFSSKIKLNQSVKKGDLLVTMDLDKIQGAGHPTTVILVVTNTDDFSSVEEVGSGSVQSGDAVLRVHK